MYWGPSLQVLHLNRVGQNHLYGVHTIIFCRDFFKYTVTYDVNTQFWPILRLQGGSTEYAKDMDA